MEKFGRRLNKIFKLLSLGAMVLAGSSTSIYYLRRQEEPLPIAVPTPDPGIPATACEWVIFPGSPGRVKVCNGGVNNDGTHNCLLPPRQYFAIQSQLPGNFSKNAFAAPGAEFLNPEMNKGIMRCGKNGNWESQREGAKN